MVWYAVLCCAVLLGLYIQYSLPLLLCVHARPPRELVRVSVAQVLLEDVVLNAPLHDVVLGHRVGREAPQPPPAVRGVQLGGDQISGRGE
jgi:hypothetical protein